MSKIAPIYSASRASAKPIKGLCPAGYAPLTQGTAIAERGCNPLPPLKGRLGASPFNQKKGYIPLKEQLMSDDIQQVYANRLHFQQKLK